MKVSADLDLCQGHQMCVLEAPSVFGFDAAADHVAVLDHEPDESLRDEVARAIRYCPTTALTMSEEP